MIKELIRRLKKMHEDRIVLQEIVDEARQTSVETTDKLRLLNAKLNNGVSARIYQAIRGY